MSTYIVSQKIEYEVVHGEYETRTIKAIIEADNAIEAGKSGEEHIAECMDEFYTPYGKVNAWWGISPLYIHQEEKMNKQKQIIKLKADPNCKACNGSGIVYDKVDAWGSSTSMPSECECALENCTDEQWEAILDGAKYEIIPNEPETEEE